MAARQPNADRVRLFSDGVFAVLITILVLELKPPHEETFSALLPLWPTGLSYAVSYLFIAIVWVNHHHLFNFAELATQRLVWFNFAHLFSVSLVPFATVWIAETRLAAAPVALYAAVFVLVNVTYLALSATYGRTFPFRARTRTRRNPHQWPRWTTSSIGRRSGLPIGVRGRSAG